MNNYNPFMNNQFYMNELQSMREKIDSQMRNLQQQNQVPQPLAQQPITQNFQIAAQPNSNELEARYADNIDTVKNTFVMKTGIFTTKDFKNIWIKDTNGNIRTFNTEEIKELDDKDREILSLKQEIKQLKEEVSNANESINANANEQITINKPTRISNNKHINAKQQQSTRNNTSNDE